MSHELIRFEGGECPVCKLQERIAALEDDLVNAEGELNDVESRLEEKVARLEAELEVVGNRGTWTGNSP